jgi:hypothetical protein
MSDHFELEIHGFLISAFLGEKPERIVVNLQLAVLQFCTQAETYNFQNSNFVAVNGKNPWFENGKNIVH